MEISDTQKEFMIDLWVEYNAYKHRYDNVPDLEVKAVAKRLGVLPFETWFILKMNNVL